MQHKYFRKVRVSIKNKQQFNVYIFADSTLADLTLGPNEDGAKGQHWRKMMDQPGERLFVWHALHYGD